MSIVLSRRSDRESQLARSFCGAGAERSPLTLSPRLDAMDQQPIAILIGALGGQGGGVLAEWLVETATRAGYIAQGTSIPGVAQRTGATTYYVEIHPIPAADLDGRRPVL